MILRYKRIKNKMAHFSIVLLVILLISGCAQPSQSVAPSSEIKASATQTNYRPFEIQLGSKIGLEHYTATVELIPQKFRGKYEWWFKDGTRDVTLIAFTKYKEEKIQCIIAEYYDGRYNGQWSETSDLVMDVDNNQVYNAVFFSISFANDYPSKPRNVRYDVSCKGLKSGYESKKTFHLRLEYPEK